MGFSRQEYWSGLPSLPPGDLPNPGIKSVSPVSPALAGRFFMGCMKHQEDRATLGGAWFQGPLHLDWLHFQCRGRRGAWGHMQALVAAWVWEALVEGGNGEKGQGGRRHRRTLLPQCACPSSPFSPGVCLGEQELQGDQRRKKRFISPSPPHSPPPPIKSHDMKLQLNCVGKPGTFLFIWDNSTELTQIFNCGFTAFMLRGVWPFVAFWIVAPQALSSMGFFRHEYWRWLPCPPPRDLPHPGIKPGSPALQADSFFTVWNSDGAHYQFKGRYRLACIRRL